MTDRLMSTTPFAYLFAPRLQTGRVPAPSSQPTSVFSFEAGDWVVLGLYLGALAFGVLHHQPWIDEAQAWLLAHDASLRELLLRRLHYEGAPPLWHLLLKALIALHLPYAALNWVAAALAVPGIVLLLGCSPFPRLFRWLLPFTFYLQYQYAVLARPYVLLPGLLFLLCMGMTSTRPRPVLVALNAGLLAMVNAHTAILSCFLMLLYLWERRRAGVLPSAGSRRRVWLAAGLFVAFLAVDLAVAFPAPDAMVVPSATGKIKSRNSLLVRWIPPERLPFGAPPLDPPPVATSRSGAPESANATSQAAPASASGRSFGQRLAHKLQLTAVRSGNLLTFPVAESNVLGVAFLLSLGVWLWSRHSLETLLPWLLTVPLAAFIWVYDHHSGIIALALVAAVWLTLQRTPAASAPQWPAALFSTLALVVVVLQIGWTIHALRAEARQPYDAGKQTAAFLREFEPGKRVDAFGFQTVSLQPYLDRNPFSNWEHRYWLWSNSNAIDLRLTEALQQAPEVVVIADQIGGQDTLDNQWAAKSPVGYRPALGLVQFWERHGYRETHRFCGTRLMRGGSDEMTCELLLERAAR